MTPRALAHLAGKIHRACFDAPSARRYSQNAARGGPIIFESDFKWENAHFLTCWLRAVQVRCLVRSAASLTLRPMVLRRMRVACAHFLRQLMMRDCNCDPRQLACPFISVFAAGSGAIYIFHHALLTLLHRAALLSVLINAPSAAAPSTLFLYIRYHGRTKSACSNIITLDAPLIQLCNFIHFYERQWITIWS